MNLRGTLTAVLALLAVTHLCSCISTLPREKKAPARPHELEIVSDDTEDADLFLPPLENLEPSLLTPEAETTLPVMPELVGSQDDLVTTSYRPPYEESRLEDLVCEIMHRLQNRFRDLGEENSADPGQPIDMDTTENLSERCQIGLGLAALSLLKPGGEENEEAEARAVTLDAVRVLQTDPTGGVEAKLVAAAYLERTGLTAERNSLLREVIASTPPESMDSADKPQPFVDLADPPVPSPAVSSTGTGFRLRDVCFAYDISGLGSYTARNDARFSPGEVALVYGEFVGFEDRTEEDESGPVYSREFSASLQLVDSVENVIEKDDFLKPGGGVSRGPHQMHAVNFWARYEFPADLPAGNYGLQILATDQLAKQNASVMLKLEITAPDEFKADTK